MDAITAEPKLYQINQQQMEQLQKRTDTAETMLERVHRNAIAAVSVQAEQIDALLAALAPYADKLNWEMDGSHFFYIGPAHLAPWSAAAEARAHYGE